MSAHIALLRGVNLGGHKKVAMADLRACLTAMGCPDARTLLNSGNLVFRGGSRSRAALERWLEGETGTRLGLQTDFHVRTAKAWDAIIAHNPFPEAAKRDPARLLLMCFKEAPDPAGVVALQAAIKAFKGREVVRAHGTEAYIIYPDGQGTSRLTTALIDSKLGRGTGRNWNTVLKLAVLANE